jgi:hypothetical protein
MLPVLARPKSALRATLSYVAAAGSVCFVINLLVNVKWRDLVGLARTPTGQAEGVALGAVIMIVMALRRDLNKER